MTHAEDIALRLRDDEVTEPDRREEYQAVAPAVEAARTLVPGGYRMELRLPWTQVGVKPQVGAVCGFNVYVNDVDAREDVLLQGELAAARWYPEVSAILNTTALHSLRLADAPSAPVDAAAWLAYASDRPGEVRIQVAAPAAYTGETVVIRGGGAPLARGVFEAAGGRALATLFASSRAVTARPTNEVTRLLVGERQAGTLDMALIPESVSLLRHHGHGPSLGARLPRTMRLLTESSPANRHPVTIVFYGQSITAQHWWWSVARELRERFPHADLRVMNRSIGGHTMPVLLQTAEADLFPEYPDLVVLRAYEMYKDGSLETMVRNLRSRTTAEILLMNHHVSGHDYRLADNRAVREIGAAYGCEVAEVSDQWGHYLAQYGLRDDALRSDGVHLNAAGCELMAQLVARHFQYVPAFSNHWSETVATLPVRPGRRGRIRMVFEGNRVDLVAGALPAGEKAGAARILIDGRPPSQIPELYAFTRVQSLHPGYWSIPYLRKVGSEAPRVEEEWTCRVIEAHAGKDVPREEAFFRFEVEGTVTGKDGVGENRNRFVSDSGRVVIEPESWAASPSPGMVGVTFTWRSLLHGADVYRAAPAGSHVTLAQCLRPGRHTLEILPDGDGAVPVETIVAHRPPLAVER